jgi:hypothetical protein
MQSLDFPHCFCVNVTRAFDLSDSNDAESFAFNR